MRAIRIASAVLCLASSALAVPEGALELRLLDGAGNPVGGAAVLVLPVAEGQAEPPAVFTPPAVVRPGDPGDRVPVWNRTKERADSEGRYRAEGLEDRDYWIVASLEGMEEVWTRARPGAVDLVLRVPGLREIAGVCVDSEDGKPVANVALWVGEDYPRGSVTLQRRPTDAEGRFRVQGLLPGPYRLSFGGVPESFGEREEMKYDREHLGKYLEGVRAGTTDLVVPLPRGLSISGRLVDDLGNAAPGVTVEAVRQSSTGGEYMGGRTPSEVSGPDGRFRIPQLAPGLYGLKIGSASDHAGTIASFHDMETDLAKDGKPAEEPRELVANRRYAPRKVDHVKAGTEALEVRVMRDIRIRGSLVDVQGRPFRPGVELKVYVVPSDGEFAGACHGFEGTADGDGKFETPPLDAAGSYDICFFWADRKASGAARAVKAGTDGVRIRVTKGRSIAGLVRDENGAPVGAGVPVESLATGLVDDAPGGFVRTETREDGTFVLPDLPEMSVLLFTGGGTSPYRRSVSRGEYLPGESGVEITARRGAVLAGRLLEADGAAFVSAGSGPTFPVAPDGSFRIGGLSAGKTVLRAWTGSGERVLAELEAPAEGLEIRASR